MKIESSHRNIIEHKLDRAKWKSVLLYSFAIWMISENIIGALVYWKVSATYGSLIVYVKYLVMLVFASLAVEKILKSKIHIKTPDILAIVYVCWILIFLLYALATHISLGTYAYLYLSPVMTYFAGKYFCDMSYEHFLRFLVKLALVIVIFGFLDYLVFEELFWKDFLEYGNYTDAVKGLGETIDGLPGNFYFDPYFLKLRRMVSTFGDPLSMGYFLFIVLGFVYHDNKKIANNLVKIVLVSGLIMTLTRAAIIAFLLTFILKKLFGKYGLYFCLFVGIAALSLIYSGVISDLGDDSSTAGHMQSILLISDYLNFSRFSFGALENEEFRYFEPGFVNIVVNFGIIGLFLFCIFVVGLYSYLYKNEHKSIALIFAAGLITLMVFSQSFFSTSASWLAWFMAGWFVSQRRLPAVI